MIKEFITIHKKETTVKVQSSKIDAIRVTDITKKGVRVYDKGLIGISGAIGDRDEDELVQEAIQNLKCAIPYPYEPTTYDRDVRKFNKKPMKKEELLSISESILETLRVEYNHMDFSNDLSIVEVEMTMTNDQGLDLGYKDAYFNMGLIIKEKKSGNIFDGFLSYYGRTFDLEKFWAFNKPYLAAYSQYVELPEGEKLPVFSVNGFQSTQFLDHCLNGENYVNKSSIFADKLDAVLFNRKLTIEQCRDPFYTGETFFDMEGKTSPHGKECLIDHGQFVRVYTDKKTASDYNLPYTGSASGAYDGRPSLVTGSLRTLTDSTNIKEALKGQLAILVLISSGGDFTPDGSFAAPVQVSFLFDGEKIVGKLKEFTMSSHIYQMLGEDYIGTFDNTALYIGDHTQLQGCYMTIRR
jgi:PmbA protein